MSIVSERLRQLGFLVPEKEKIHFLHIGKTGGVAINNAISRINLSNVCKYNLVSHGHPTKIWDLPNRANYFFCIRDPITRFVSGFYSRKRKGLPRKEVRWSISEERSFGIFPNANDLAESIYSSGQLGLDAFTAMTGIMHVSDFQYTWFNDVRGMFTERPPVAILRQESLSADFFAFQRLLRIESPVDLTTDKVQSHANDYSGVPALTENAIANLKAWYAGDIYFVNRALEWIGNSRVEGLAAKRWLPS